MTKRTFATDAHYNPDAARIEIRLYAKRAHSVRIADLDLTVDFEEGESIWTENSHKFTREHAARLLESSGMAMEAWYTDEQEYFGLALASAS